MPWRSEETSRVCVETAAFELLSQLCDGSAKGGRAVVGAADFQHSFNRALEIVSSIDSSPTSAEISDDDDQASNVAEQEESGHGASGEQDTLEDFTDAKDNCRIKIDHDQLVKAAISYLSALIPISGVRAGLLGSRNFIRASSALVDEDRFPDLQFEAVKVFSKLAPYCSINAALPPEHVGDLLQHALAMESQQNQPLRNSLLVHAAEGIQFVYDSLHESKQIAILREVVLLYSKLLKSHSLSRAVVQGNDKPKGGELAYHLTTIMMVANGKDSVEQCFDLELLTFLVNTIQWRYDPKTVISEEEICFWDGAATQSLQLIAQCLWRDTARLLKAGIKTRNLKESVLMTARPGKAPRKAIDFPSALSIVVKNGESASKLAAQRILRCLNADN